MKQLFFSLLFTVLFVHSYAQYTLSPGITLQTTRLGEDAGIPKPHPDSPIYKIRYEVLSTVDFMLWTKEYTGGQYKPSQWERILSGIQTKGSRLIGEMIPDDLSSPITLRLFFNFAGGFQVMFYMTKTEGLCRKFVTFDTVDTPEDRREFIPYLLIYEDDPADGKEEQIVSKYLKDGKLPYDKATVNKLISGLSRCALVYADIECKPE